MGMGDDGLRWIIREELTRIVEGILDGTSNGITPKPVPSDVRATSRARDLENAKRAADLAAKRLGPAIKPAKPEVGAMTAGDVKKMVQDFGKEKTTPITPADAGKASAAVLNLTKRDPQGAREMLATMKSNPKLRTAVLSTPGMTDLQTAADTNLRAAGKDPRTAVGDEWREIGKLASKYNLSEARVLAIIHEELLDEGWLDRMFDMFRGDDGGERASNGRPLRLVDLIPLNDSVSRAGFKRSDIERISSNVSTSMMTRTYPAAFHVGVSPTGDGIEYGHPHLVKGALDEQPALERYVGGRHHNTTAPALVIPDTSKFSRRERLGDTIRFPKGTPSDRELRGMGVNMTQWEEYTRGLPPEVRVRRARELGRALTVVRALEDAFKVMDNVLGSTGARLIRPRA